MSTEGHLKPFACGRCDLCAATNCRECESPRGGCRCEECVGPKEDPRRAYALRVAEAVREECAEECAHLDHDAAHIFEDAVKAIDLTAVVEGVE